MSELSRRINLSAPTIRQVEQARGTLRPSELTLASQQTPEFLESPVHTVFTTRAASQWQMLPFVAHDRFGYDTGMIGLTIFGLIFTPAFYIVARWMAGLTSRKPTPVEEHPAPHPAE